MPLANNDPIAYFITWVTYGTWLPGEERGWVDYRQGWQIPSRILEEDCAARMSEGSCVLTPEERMIVERQVAETCEYRGWQLYAVQCRSNHVHVVVASTVTPELIREQLKAWCSRRLNEHRTRTTADPGRAKWWAERGSIRWIWKDDSLVRVVEYVVEQQDNPRRYES